MVFFKKIVATANRFCAELNLTHPTAVIPRKALQGTQAEQYLVSEFLSSAGVTNADTHIGVPYLEYFNVKSKAPS